MLSEPLWFPKNLFFLFLEPPVPFWFDIFKMSEVTYSVNNCYVVFHFLSLYTTELFKTMKSQLK